MKIVLGIVKIIISYSKEVEEEGIFTPEFYFKCGWGRGSSFIFWVRLSIVNVSW